MTDFLRYIFQEVESKRLSKSDAMEMVRQFEQGRYSDPVYNLEEIIHPLLHRNTSRLFEHRFSSIFNGRDFFTDQKLMGQQILPGVVHLEMARSAVANAIDLSTNSALQISNVIWAKPIVIGEEEFSIHIGLHSVDDPSVAEEPVRINYEIYSDQNIDDRLVYGQGQVTIREVPLATIRDLTFIRGQCDQFQLNTKEVYNLLGKVGMDYGSVYQCLGDVFVGKDQLLAKIRLLKSMADNANDFALHPCILDAIVQGSMVLVAHQTDEVRTKLLLPYSLEKMCIFHPFRAEMWAYVRYYRDGNKGGVFKLDIDLCDDNGQICAHLKGFSFRELVVDNNALIAASKTGIIMAQPYWREYTIAPSDNEKKQGWGTHRVIFCEAPDGLRKDTVYQLEAKFGSVQSFNLHYEHTEIDKRYITYAGELFKQLRVILAGKPKAPILIQIVIPIEFSTDDERILLAGLTGLLKTAHRENPKIIGQIIEVDTGTTAVELVEVLLGNPSAGVEHIRYHGGRCWVADWREVDGMSAKGKMMNSPWSTGGVYLITGGAGSLGLMFVEDIVSHTKGARIILIGRSGLSEAKSAQLNDLESHGCKIEYRQVDVVDQSAVIELLTDIENTYGGLNGIMHSAGMIRDNFILNKQLGELSEVLAPKVSGLVNLDYASRNMNLDFLVLFSSMAGALGNVGQADYAAGNSFMDAYAHYRNQLVAKGQRRGKTLSINWPLWKEGGMLMDAQSEQVMTQNTGMVAMRSETGLRAFYQMHAGKDGGQWMVIEGDLNRMHEKLLGQVIASDAVESFQSPAIDTPVSEADRERLHDKTLHCVKKLFGDVVRMDVDKIDSDEPLESYGIDSIMITRLNRQLGEFFGELSKTLFYEYQTLSELTDYFLSAHQQTCRRWTGLDEQLAESTAMQAAPPTAQPDSFRKQNGFPVLTSFRGKASGRGNGSAAKAAVRRFNVIEGKHSEREPIAIIGISGRYPQASNLQEFWQNLAAGKDCISEVPEDRWSLQGFFVDDQKTAIEQGKSYSKWGGFIENFAEFDPLFFGISPREAISMDPQERLFLESCWHTFEDACYTRERLAQQHRGRVGVFAGITKTGFDLYGPALWQQGEQAFPHTSFSSVANRLSYFMNLHGPSMPIDTMCSSSLTAIHEACEHLHRDDCELAIAGGVNLYVHPSTYVWLSALQMLSVDGKCKSFGDGGNGFVPGEGVGTVLLKSLSRAEADHDHIYAIIRATCINHGGKTNGYTVPSPTAQGELIREAIEKAGVDVRAISYIEAHGTGTELGDPIEVTGLTQAFRKDTQDTQFCALGSAKSNIGHLEAAAGIAGLTKILLQMQHRQLVPSLHAKKLNPNINFEKTPFVVQQELSEWKRPLIEQNGEIREYPRFAGVSSFGAGGANAHVIVEEYVSEEKEQSSECRGPKLIILSAKTGKQLKVYAQQLLDYIDQQPDLNITNLAYTLQVGREAMDERLGLLVESIELLREMLQQYTKGEKNIDNLYSGRAKQYKATISVFASDKAFQEVISKWIERRQYNKLLELWVKGLEIEWSSLYENYLPKIISLPTYPFLQERIWIPKISNKSAMNVNQYNENGEDFVEKIYDNLFDEVLGKRLTVDNAIKRISQEIM